PMLTIRDLVKIYPGKVMALQGINLDVPPGMFGLLGPNGAGKSTLMKILSGLLEATSGEVTLDGEDVLARPEQVRRRLGYLPQEFGFYPHLTGEKMLSYLLQLKGVEAPGGLKPLVADLLERVNLSSAAKRKVKTYSGGMRQRLRFYRLLAELAADRIVLLSTHIVEDVAVLCPRFAVIRKGRLVAQTSPSEAREAIDGRIFEGRVSREEMDEVRNRLRVTQAVLVEGKNRVRIYQPTGEAVYLLLMQDGSQPMQPAQPGRPQPYERPQQQGTISAGSAAGSAGGAA